MSKLKYIYNKVAKVIGDSMYPEHIKCLGCGKDISKLNIYDVCDKCKKDLEFNNGRRCARCGKNVFGQSNYCFNCKNTLRHFDKATAPFLYTGLVKTLIRRFKYKNAPYLARTFARWLAQEYIKSDFDVDVVVYVPMHKDKLSKRGYNQAELLAFEFCKIVGLPLAKNFLIKNFDTDTQTHKSRDEREHLENIYSLTHKDYFRGKKILLIDDVITTGSTMDACAEALGASKVYGLAIAHSKSRIRQATTPKVLVGKKFAKKVVL